MLRGRNGSCSSRMDFPLIYLQFATLHRFMSLMLLNCCFFCVCVYVSDANLDEFI